MLYYAHTKKDSDEKQLLIEHLRDTAEKSGNFASKFEQRELGRIAGLLHDLGKYSKEFQKRLDGGEKVDHSTAGAIESIEKFKQIGELILAYCIAGHHGSLPDTNDLEGRFDNDIKDYSAYKNELKEELKADFSSVFNNINSEKELPFAISFLTRMIYSCLIDADWLDTEKFVEGKGRSESEKLENLREKLTKKLEELAQTEPEKEINQKRAEILKQCQNKAKWEKGLYSLTVPTGGGKTLSSLAFAMEHAKEHGQDRIIYAIPYTSIIEQNAQVFRKIFGDKNVLEHHCNYIFEEQEEKKDEDENQSTAEKLKKASENWDAPIIATTNVQFFESLFANKKKKCRKLHNIANSIIILDEAQMIPPEYLIPCTKAIEELVLRYNCTVVLCTATQPSLDKFFSAPPKEIMPDPDALFKDKIFDRVEVKYIGKKSDEELKEKISELEQVLVIVNTKKHAFELYKRLEGQEGVCHLSTFMYPAHRKQVIEEIKNRLKDALPIKVISTQLIEAGVDIDFPVVYRSPAGLDSIAQSAGRCNREGRLEKGFLYVFESEEKHGMPQGTLKMPAQVGKDSIRKFSNNLLGTDAIRDYFGNLFFYKGEQLDLNGIMKLFKVTNRRNFDFPFKEVSSKFRFIKDNMFSVVVPVDDKAKGLVEKLRYAEFPKKYLRQLQSYTVNLFEQDYKAILNKEEIKDLTAVMLNPDNDYDPYTGVVIDKDSKALFD